MEFILASNNKGKIAEMERILTGMGHSVMSQKQAQINADPEENGATFEENALIKAREIARIAKKPTIADDSGLCVDALNGAPGVHSARYCGKHGYDDENNIKLQTEMKSVTAQQRHAQFVSVICVYFPCDDIQNDKYFFAKGICPGQIAFECAGDNGFGYDPLFVPNFVGAKTEENATIPNTTKRTYAQLEDYEKDEISHRAQALNIMKDKLDEFLKNA